MSNVYSAQRGTSLVVGGAVGAVPEQRCSGLHLPAIGGAMQRSLPPLWQKGRG